MVSAGWSRAYRRAFARPEVRAAVCGDYRAAAGPDAALDAAEHRDGKRLGCPLLALWPERPGAGPPDPHPLEVWARWAEAVDGRGVVSGHLLPEAAPGAVLEAVSTFLDRNAA